MQTLISKLILSVLHFRNQFDPNSAPVTLVYSLQLYAFPLVIEL